MVGGTGAARSGLGDDIREGNWGNVALNGSGAAGGMLEMGGIVGKIQHAAQVRQSLGRTSRRRQFGDYRRAYRNEPLRQLRRQGNVPRHGLSGGGAHGIQNPWGDGRIVGGGQRRRSTRTRGRL
jgi:hypothetical protein